MLRVMHYIFKVMTLCSFKIASKTDPERSDVQTEVGKWILSALHDRAMSDTAFVSHFGLRPHTPT